MNGILIIDKPKEYTSHDVCSKVKKIYGAKVGHTGTLDPMATGVLPLLLGEGTKLSEYLTNHNKTYEAVLKLGVQTDTLDSEGEVIANQEVPETSTDRKRVQQVLRECVGKQVQTPPMYSAIKVKGKKLYEYAREGKKVEIPQRTIEIYEMELLEINQQEKHIRFKVACSKGTYIRTLCETIAQKLGTVGYMKELKRTKVGEFSLNQAIAIEELEKNKENKEFLEEKLITIPKFFENVARIILNEQKLKLFLNGVQLTRIEPDGIYQIQSENNKWIGIGIVTNGLLKRKIVMKEHEI